jgi:hypothetical protein
MRKGILLGGYKLWSRDVESTMKLSSMVVAFVRYIFVFLEHLEIWDRDSVVAGYCAAPGPHGTHGQPYTYSSAVVKSH